MTYARIVEKYARAFREAIEEARADGVFRGNPCMEQFPHGSCGETSDLLGEYLLLNGFANLYYVSGTHYPTTGDEEGDFRGKQTHAWISIGDPTDENSLIVDITGDQFKNDPEYDYCDKPVYVGVRRRFHRLFEVERRDIHEYHGFKVYDLRTQRSLFSQYDEIVKRIKMDRILALQAKQVFRR